MIAAEFLLGFGCFLAGLLLGIGGSSFWRRHRVGSLLRFKPYTPVRRRFSRYKMRRFERVGHLRRATPASASLRKILRSCTRSRLLSFDD